MWKARNRRTYHPELSALHRCEEEIFGRYDDAGAPMLNAYEKNAGGRHRGRRGRKKVCSFAEITMKELRRLGYELLKSGGSIRETIHTPTLALRNKASRHYRKIPGLHHQVIPFFELLLLFTFLLLFHINSIKKKLKNMKGIVTGYHDFIDSETNLQNFKWDEKIIFHL